ncbi:MAG: response regulator transcription factor [Flavobacterium sp.]
MTSIALVDDHQLFRKSLLTYLNSLNGIKVVFDTADGNSLLQFLKENEVDIILLDIQMPIIDGFDLCKLIKAHHPAVKILVVSQLTTKQAVHKIMECGANGFFTKNSSPEQLETAIMSILDKNYYFDVELPKLIKEVLQWEKSSAAKLAMQQTVHFSEREIEIIKLSCRELSSKEIAGKLFISIRTVEKHRNRIMEKTNAKNFIGSIVFALRNEHISIENL